jgi:hypothetical protein
MLHDSRELKSDLGSWKILRRDQIAIGSNRDATTFRNSPQNNETVFDYT